MTSYAGQPSSFYSATGGVPVEGAWYSGRRYLGGQLLAPGEVEPGQRVSNEVIAQTNPDNVSYVNNQIEAANMAQAPSMNLPGGSETTSVVGGLQGAVDSARTNLESTLKAEKDRIAQEMQALKDKEKETLDKVGVLSTPFREELEKKKSEELYINQNFEANQVLVNELDTLLSEGNAAIKQQQEVTGLSAIRNPRIQKTMNDVAARAGVIQAVMSARNGQIAQAQNMIDRTVNAIASDRNDQINYYNTILELNNRDIISLSNESKTIAAEQLDLIKSDLSRAQATQDYVKQLMLDPASAALIGQAGVTLNDSVESINSKLSTAQYANEVREISNEISLNGGEAVIDPSSVPADRLITITDSRGVKRYYKAPAKSTGSSAKVGSTQAKIESAAKQDMSFGDFVVTYANQLSLGDIYEAYSQSPRGQQFGPPVENSREIALLYKVATGEMSATEAEIELAR